MLCDRTNVHRGLLVSVGPRVPDSQPGYDIPLCIRRVNTPGSEAGVDREARQCDDSGDHIH